VQVVYMLHNIHFTLLYVPFFYIKVGGGYCIGPVCEPHYVSFNTNLVIIIILAVNLTGLFNLLLFYRHQNLLLNSSRLKLSNFVLNGKNAICSVTTHNTAMSLCILAPLNIIPYCQMFAQYRVTDIEANRTMQLASCIFISKSRNYGVISILDATISAYIIGITWLLYMTFAISFTIHICKIMNDYANMR
ncbi:hypothetical protein PMAYCL1PPCAC_15647, partial [Pristionchus mayeri]